MVVRIICEVNCFEVVVIGEVGVVVVGVWVFVLVGSLLVGVWVKFVFKGVVDWLRVWVEGGEEEEVFFFLRVLIWLVMDWMVVRRVVWVWEMDWRVFFRLFMFVDVEFIVKVVLWNVGREMELL